jgi:tetratricopeptide (TPR) repeat protein
MKNVIFVLAIILFSVTRSFACGNYFYALNKEGKLVPLGYDWKFPFNRNFNPELNVTKLKKLEARLKKERNYMLLSDYALCLMKLGKSKEALEILAELYKHYPNEYKIAANLGTAYELNGQTDSALKYIKRGLQLNPHDHEGSEWIHVRILEAKLEMKKNPAYLSNHTVLGLTDAQKNDSTILQHLSIQLQERVPFTPPAPTPNELMASLFVDMAEISANIRSIEYARVYYQIAKNYYGSKSAFLDERIKAMEKLIHKYASVKPNFDKHFEGEQNKIGYLKYQQLLKDNNESHYTINWEKLNTNVSSLLALVDFSKTSLEVKELAKNPAAQDTTDELRFVDEHTDSIPPTTLVSAADSLSSIDERTTMEHQNAPSKNRLWLYVLGSVLITGCGYFIIKRLQKK